jgi:ubiquinone/menaquinone biosynthesis C-methylase UbiE
MNTDAGSWNDEYKQRGRLWGGAVHNLPCIPPDSHVLELGCGNGKTFFVLAQRGVDVVAVDFSVHAATMSRNVALHAPSGDVAIADARRLPFSDESFDTVIAFHVIGHMCEKDRARIAGESKRVLRQNGNLHFSGFSVEDFRAGTGRIVEPQTFERMTGIVTHYFTEPEVQALFVGLKATRLTTQRWTMRVRGKDHPRAEVVAIFKKWQDSV